MHEEEEEEEEDDDDDDEGRWQPDALDEPEDDDEVAEEDVEDRDPSHLVPVVVEGDTPVGILEEVPLRPDKGEGSEGRVDKLEGGELPQEVHLPCLGGAAS